MSPKFSLNSKDINNWKENALKFLVPFLLVFIPAVIQVIPTEWKYGALVLYVLNVLYDLLRKFVAGK